MIYVGLRVSIINSKHINYNLLIMKIIYIFAKRKYSMTEEEMRFTAAVNAMQGILESGKLGTILEASPDIVARMSIRMGDALIKQLNSNKNDNQD